jgi:hypothetical protein
MHSLGKLFVAAAIAAASTLAMTGAAAASAAPLPSYTCTGTAKAPGVIPPGVYSQLNMPRASACAITGPGSVTVHSDLMLREGAAMEVTGGSLLVDGNMIVGYNAVFYSAITEKAPVDILGSLTVRGGGAFYLGKEKPYKPVFATIQGSVTAEQASAVVIQNTLIAGSVTVAGGGGPGNMLLPPGSNYTDFEDDQILGSVSEVSYGGIWAGVIRSNIRGSLIFADNNEAHIDEYDIGSNDIHSFAFCDDNVPAPNEGHSKGSPSIVQGPTFGDQAATCTGVKGGSTGPPV